LLENGFNITDAFSKRPLIVIVASQMLHSERQIEVGDSKYVIIFDPMQRLHDVAHALWLQIHCQW